jgi:ADYC domain
MTLRIDSAAKLPAPNADLWAYVISYSADGGWKPLCGAGIAALAVPGTWDTRSAVIGGGAYSSSTTAFTFACRATTIAKCVEMGYKATLGRTNQLLTCVRLLRGDYCGTGATHTINGNQVNLYDGIGVQADTMAWTIEGEWTPYGARCISTKSNTRFASSSLPKPVCIGVTVSVAATCGTQGFTNAVIIDEIP